MKPSNSIAASLLIVLSLVTTDVSRANPAFPGLFSDPELLWSEQTGRCYIYPSTDGFPPDWREDTAYVFSSADMKDWRIDGCVFDLKSDCSWANIKLWAPCAIERRQADGSWKYFWYFAAEQKLGVAVGDRPEGPFRDALGHPLLAQHLDAKGRYYQLIDPDVFCDPKTGKCYLYWGNACLVWAELKPSMTEIGEPHFLIDRDTCAKYHYTEGTHVFYRNGLYYFSWSEFGTEDPRYCVRYLISDSPTAFVRNGKPAEVETLPIVRRDESRKILGTGHHSVVCKPGTDEWYVAYHRFCVPNVEAGGNPGFNREVCVDRLTFAEDGRIIPVTCTTRTPDPRSVVILSDIHVPLKPAEQVYKTWDAVEVRDYYWVKDLIRRQVNEILALDPLPANVIALGDISIAFAEDREYAICRELFAPLEKAGIRVTHAMGNHDIRANFLKTFPEYARTTLVRDKIVSKVETPDVDFLILDSLKECAPEQRGHQEHLRACELGDAQLAWIKTELAAAKKPVIVCAHHKSRALGIDALLASSPKVCGYLFGHHHHFESNYIFEGYWQGARVLRSVGIGSFALDGDIGYAVMRTTPTGADLRFVENGFWFPGYEPEEKRPALWKEMVKDNNGKTLRFPFE